MWWIYHTRYISFLENVDVRNTEEWNTIIDFHCKAMPKFYTALHDRLNKVAKEV